MSGPLEAYRALLAEGKLRPDPVQAMAVQKLESLAKAVADLVRALKAAARAGVSRRSLDAP